MSSKSWPEEPNVVRSDLESFDLPKTTFSELLATRIAAINPDKLALIQEPEGHRITYGQLHVRLQELAYALGHHCGIQKSDLVMYFGANSIQSMVMFATAAYMGIASTPLKPASGSFEMVQQLRDSRASVMVVDHHKLPVLRQAMDDPDYRQDVKLLVLLNSDPETRDKVVGYPKAPGKVLTFEELTEMGAGHRLETIPMYPCQSDDEFLIIYTSGTTGLPKGAVHTQSSWLASIINNEKFEYQFAVKMAGSPEAVSKMPPTIMTMPIGHISGAVFAYTCLATGRTGVVVAQPTLDLLCSLVEKYQMPTVIFPVSFIMQLAHGGDQEKRFDLKSLKLIFHGGSKIPESITETVNNKLQTKMIDVFGATEFLGGLSTLYRFGNPDNIPGNVGYVTANCQLKIVDLKTGENLPANETGEICLRGPMCFAGYRDNPEATKATIDPNGWYHTGDIGFYDKNGALHLVDRLKELIKYKDWTVAPAELEMFLHRHPAVENCCVVGVRHSTDGQLPRAYVQLKPGAQVTAEELQQLVKENLGFQKRLRGGVRFIEKIPLTAIGKVDRKKVKEFVQNELITEQID